MADTTSLTIKIDPVLKETLKTFALENQISLSQEVTQRLQASLTTFPPIDSQNVTEVEDDRLSAAELKQVRLLLKRSKKKK